MGRKIPRGWGIPSPPLLTHLTVSEKSPPWVGNPFPTLLATLNITCGREILLTVFLHYPQTWWERDFQPEIRVKKGGERIS